MIKIYTNNINHFRKVKGMWKNITIVALLIACMGAVGHIGVQRVRLERLGDLLITLQFSVEQTCVLREEIEKECKKMKGEKNGRITE